MRGRQPYQTLSADQLKELLRKARVRMEVTRDFSNKALAREFNRTEYCIKGIIQRARLKDTL